MASNVKMISKATRKRIPKPIGFPASTLVVMVMAEISAGGQVITQHRFEEFMVFDAWKLRNGRLEDSDFPKINDAMAVLSEAPIFIDDSAMTNIMEMRTKARRLQSEHHERQC